jgi:hypothetical protein
MNRRGIARGLWALALALLVNGCSTVGSDWNQWTLWDRTEVGEIQGKILLEWVDTDRFIYQPDPENPLTFIRKKNGEVIDIITPDKAFYTDGGSIPKGAQFLEDLSPWRFGPAYIIHDWLLELNHCDLPGAEKYNHRIAATIMAEVIKTQLLAENPNPTPDELAYNQLVLFNVYQPVKQYSGPLWEKAEGRCDLYLGEE